MSKLIGLSIDVSKINKEKLYKGKKGTYLKLTINLKDEKDDYGNDVSCWEEQTEEERKAKADRNFLGNGKVFWESEPQENKEPSKKEGEAEEVDDDLPF